jgi:hypothetical protein
MEIYLSDSSFILRQLCSFDFIKFIYPENYAATKEMCENLFL